MKADRSMGSLRRWASTTFFVGSCSVIETTRVRGPKIRCSHTICQARSISPAESGSRGWDVAVSTAVVDAMILLLSALSIPQRRRELGYVEDRTITRFVRAAEVDRSAIRSRLRRQRYDARSWPSRPVRILVGVSHAMR